MEEVFETQKIEYIVMTTCSSNIIEPIFNRKLGNTFHHLNSPNQRQLVYTHVGIINPGPSKDQITSHLHTYNIFLM